MARTVGEYYLSDGTRVVSVTTVLFSYYPDGIEPLLGWANRLGRQGLDHRGERDKAADIGTLCHTAAEAYTKGEIPTFEAPEDVASKARMSFEAFLSWAGDTKFRVDATELPLVSEAHRFGGRLDAAYYQGRRVIADYKTANILTAKTLVQISGYGILWDENFPSDPVQGYLALRFDKMHGDFHAHGYAELDSAREMFLMLRRGYEITKELTRRAK